jgi:hypothetical protein
MKYAVAITTLIASAMAAAVSSDCPKPSPTATVTDSVPSATAAPPAGPTGYFGVISSRSASPIHLQSLTARGGKFYLGGGPPSSYCPPNIGAENCPPGNTTVLAGGQSTLSLGVVVPGGQQVYVGPDGALSYTIAHSAAIPEGSDVTGFSRQSTLSLGVVVPGGQQVYVGPDGALSYTVAHSAAIPEGSDVTGFSRTAPADGNVYGYLNYETGFIACPAGEGEGYQVFGAIETGEFGDDCLGFTALAVAIEEPGAWQY